MHGPLTGGRCPNRLLRRRFGRYRSSLGAFHRVGVPAPAVVRRGWSGALFVPCEAAAWMVTGEHQRRRERQPERRVAPLSAPFSKSAPVVAIVLVMWAKHTTAWPRAVA